MSIFCTAFKSKISYSAVRTEADFAPGGVLVSCLPELGMLLDLCLYVYASIFAPGNDYQGLSVLIPRRALRYR
eukprot:2671194-Pyramimonas_sp.AAC.1